MAQPSLSLPTEDRPASQQIKGTGRKGNWKLGCTVSPATRARAARLRLGARLTPRERDSQCHPPGSLSSDRITSWLSRATCVCGLQHMSHL